jgi:transposase
LDGLGEIDWKTALADGMFARAKKGGDSVGKTKCGKGTKLMTMVDLDGTPLALGVYSASPSEVRLIEPMLTHRVLARLPQRLVYDRAADSDPLRERLRERGIELVCPHRKGRKKPPTQDGRKLKIYKHRWPVERTNAWLQNFRRVLVRHEYYPENYLAFVQAACLIVTLRKLLPAEKATCSLTA